MLNLYYHATPNSLKVAVLLHELDLPFQVTPMDIFKGEQHADAYLAVNPNGKVPALTDGAVTVFDSHAILIHLAEKHGAFLPTDPGPRAATFSWLQFVATGVSPFSGQAVHFLHYAPQDLPYATTRYVTELERHYQVLDRHLADREWLAGDRYTIADMALYGWAASAGYIFGDKGLSGYPEVERFLSRMNDRPAVQAALALKQEHSFKHDLDGETRQALFAADRLTTSAAA